jgi:hypothetical protein
VIPKSGNRFSGKIMRQLNQTLKNEATPGRCGGGNPGPLIFIGSQTHPTSGNMT